MSKDTIEAMVDGGKASAGPPLGPALGPAGVNIGKVIATINEKTKSFAGIKVPVKVVVDKDTKEFEIIVGSPPTSQLLKKEVNLEKLSGKAGSEPVADVKMQQIIKVSMMKEEAMAVNSRKAAVKCTIGTCVSAGILVEGKNGKETMKDVETGKYDKMITEGKTEISAEEMKELEAEKKKLAEETEAKHKQEEEAAKEAEAVPEVKEGEEETKDEEKEESAPEEKKE